jgi:hypothetical protein
MDQNFQTSFIPKKPIVNERATSSRPVGILFIISLFVLIAVLVATGGIYFYQKSLENKIGVMENSLETAKNSFEPAKIDQLQLLDKRLKASTEILSNHITITPVFDALQQVTMKSVRFTKFNYDLGTDGKTVDIKMSGQAIGYRSIALQADLFSTNKNLIDPVFSNLTLDTSGNVLFDLDFSVPSDFVNYQKAFLTQTQS